MLTIEQFSAIINLINDAYEGNVCISGIKKMAEFAERYGMEEVAIATDICLSKYDSDKFFSMIGGVLYNRHLPAKDIESRQ